ncbi:MAG: hypothetical protein Q9159_001284 [Coniocarpon cinnabarinum]
MAQTKCFICKPEPIEFCDESHLKTHALSKDHLRAEHSLKCRVNTDPVAQFKYQQYLRWRDIHRIEEEALKRAERARLRKELEAKKAHGESLGDKEGGGPRRKSPQGNATSQRSTNPALETEQASNENPNAMRAFVEESTYPTSQTWDRDRVAVRNATYVEESSPLRIPETSEKSSARDPGSVKAGAESALAGASQWAKGPQYPGMYAFDAALPEMKRKRNQKKDVSVFITLKRNSENIQAVEEVWYDNLDTVKRTQPITGRVESSSPCMEDDAIQPSRTRRRVSRAATLRDKDANQPVTNLRTYASSPYFESSGLPIPLQVDHQSTTGKGGLYHNQSQQARQIEGQTTMHSGSSHGVHSQQCAGGMQMLTSEFHPPQQTPNLDNAFGYPGYAPATTPIINGADFSSTHRPTAFRTGFQPDPHSTSLSEYWTKDGYNLAGFLQDHASSFGYRMGHTGFGSPLRALAAAKMQSSPNEGVGSSAPSAGSHDLSHASVPPSSSHDTTFATPGSDAYTLQSEGVTTQQCYAGNNVYPHCINPALIHDTSHTIDPS